MPIQFDPDLEMVIAFIDKSGISHSKRVPVVDALHKLAPMLWGQKHYEGPYQDLRNATIALSDFDAQRLASHKRGLE